MTQNVILNRNISLVLFAVIFFVAPLLFFTDLTRNPYYLQITLLNSSILGLTIIYAVESLKAGTWKLPKSILNFPWLVLFGVYFLSFAYSYFNHEEFFRPAMRSEAIRVFMFTIVNCFLVYFISVGTPFDANPVRISVFKWFLLMFFWSALWIFFPFLRQVTSSGGLMDNFWDPYGGILWLGGIFIAIWALKGARQEDFLHLALVTGAIASLYGVLQYFQVELIWPKILNPYGNRSVSTFGNPNFISSYIVVLLPVVTAYLLVSKSRSHRIFYGLIFILYQSMLLASLTRSSWLGAAVVCVFLILFREYRQKIIENRKFLIPFFAFSFLFFVFWPSNSLKPLSSAVLERVSEGVNTNPLSNLSIETKQENIYPSLHQRILIWSSTWQMGLENPLIGKGWGMLELFYPFYQGPLLTKFETIRNLRTHANNAHNEVLEVWSQTGLVGIGVHVWFFLILFYGFLKSYKNSGPEYRYWTIPLMAGVVGMFADNMLNVSLHFAVPAMIFWWIVGALCLRVTSGGAVPEFSIRAWNRKTVYPVRNLQVETLKDQRVKSDIPILANISNGVNRWVALAMILFCCIGIWTWYLQFMREVHYFRGFKFMRKNDFASASKELRIAYDYHSREVNNNYELGNAYVKTGEFEKAKWAYAEALKSNSGYDEIFFNCAIVNKKLEEWDTALKNLKMSLLINSLNLATYSALAEIFIKEPSRYAKESIEIFEDSLKIFSQDANIMNTLGYFYTLVRDYKKARDVYAKSVKIEPNNPMLAENLKRVVMQLGLKYDKDIEWLNIYNEVELKIRENDYSDRTVKLSEKLMDMDPGNLNSLFLRAKVLYKLNRLDEAKQNLMNILKYKPLNHEVRYGLAVIFEKEGKFADAKREFNRLIEISPGDANVIEHLKNIEKREIGE